MNPYKSTSGKTSVVTAFNIGEKIISVQFRGGVIYHYTDTSCGSDAVETMSQLALNSNGLSKYIAQNKPEYESKE